MCSACNIYDPNCCVLPEFDGQRYFLSVVTDIPDDESDEYYRKKVYVNYCPFCGSKLVKGKIIDPYNDFDLTMVQEGNQKIGSGRRKKKGEETDPVKVDKEVEFLMQNLQDFEALANSETLDADLELDESDSGLE